MKKISSTLKNSAEFVVRPFALLGHEHVEYVPIDSNVPIVISSPIVFTGSVSGDIDQIRPTFTAGEAISALRIVASDDAGNVLYADPADPDSCRRLVGLSISSALLGETLETFREGKYVDGAWSWDITKRLFLGAGGTITQVAPTTGISVVLGHAQKPNTIFLNIEKPINLI